MGLHKAYVLSLFGENERISLSKDLLEIAAMVVIGSTVYRPRAGEGEAYERSLERAILYNNVKDFYVHTYLPMLHADDTLDPVQLTYLLPYMLTEMFTMYTNDVEANLKKYFAKYVKLVASVRDKVDWLRRTQSNEWRRIEENLVADAAEEGRNPPTPDELAAEKADFDKKRKATIAKIYAEADKVVEMLMGDRAAAIPATLAHFTGMINDLRQRLPARAPRHPAVAYDLKVRPLAYFPVMLYMVDQMERVYEAKLPSLFPLKRSFIVDHCPLDTRAVLEFLCSAETKRRCRGNIRAHENEIWAEIFKINGPAFKATFAAFDFFVKTDAFSMSTNFKLNEAVPARGYQPEKYVQNLTPEEREHLVGKRLVAYDPNKGNLVLAVNGDGQDADVFRYTAQYRRVEGKMKKYEKKRLKIKQQEQVNGASLEAIETNLKQYNSRSVQLAEFLRYIHAKSGARVKMKEVYSRLCWRKFRFAEKLAIKKLEKKVMDDFEAKFGPPGEVVVAAGDWSAKRNMRGKRATPGIGTRKMLAKRRYEVVLVDEYRSSKRCSHCGAHGEEGVTEQFLRIEHPDDRRDGTVLSWAILRCTSCGMVWNRDRNAAINLWRIARSELDGNGRPAYLRRGAAAADPPSDDSSDDSSDGDD